VTNKCLVRQVGLDIFSITHYHRILLKSNCENLGLDQISSNSSLLLENVMIFKGCNNGVDDDDDDDDDDGDDGAVIGGILLHILDQPTSQPTNPLLALLDRQLSSGVGFGGERQGR
jgi:hypothetical protein